MRPLRIERILNIKAGYESMVLYSLLQGRACEWGQQEYRVLLVFTGMSEKQIYSQNIPNISN